MLQGAAAVQLNTEPLGKTTLFQSRKEPGITALAVVLVPPKVEGQGVPGGTATVQAPVGRRWMAPPAKLWGLAWNPRAGVYMEHMTLDPPRSTVGPLPVISQLTPARGEKFL